MGSDKNSGTSVNTDELTYKVGKTILTNTEDVSSEEGSGSIKGWEKVFHELKKLVEWETAK